MSSIHVKLPPNIGEQMAKGQRELAKFRDALGGSGFPASLEPPPATISTSSSTPIATVIPTQTTFFDQDIIGTGGEDLISRKISHPKQQRTWKEERTTETTLR